MSRLINADELLSYIDRVNNCGLGKKKSIEYITKYINNMSTAYNVDEIVKDIKEIGDRFCNSVKCDKNCDDCEHGCLMRGISEVVKAGVKE